MKRLTVAAVLITVALVAATRRRTSRKEKAVPLNPTDPDATALAYPCEIPQGGREIDGAGRLTTVDVEPFLEWAGKLGDGIDRRAEALLYEATAP